MDTNFLRKEISVPFLDVGKEPLLPKEIAKILEQQTSAHKLDQIPWRQFPYRPRVNFRIAWTCQDILLSSHVVEDDIRTVFHHDNDPVHRDSCVEFFIAPGDGSYFNFEFNARGVTYAARGVGREDSAPLPIEAVKKIRRYSSLDVEHAAQGGNSGFWTLGIAVPLSLFVGTPLENPGTRSFGANFYKCGDDTRQPHFVTWNPVGTEEPDFHRPEYFGFLRFRGTEEKETSDA
jgi:hypothetical protein